MELMDLDPNEKRDHFTMGSKKPKTKKFKRVNPKVPLMKEEQYEQEIAHLKRELYYTQMERDFLKKLDTVLENKDQEQKLR